MPSRLHHFLSTHKLILQLWFFVWVIYLTKIVDFLACPRLKYSTPQPAGVFHISKCNLIEAAERGCRMMIVWAGRSCPSASRRPVPAQYSQIISSSALLISTRYFLTLGLHFFLLIFILSSSSPRLLFVLSSSYLRLLFVFSSYSLRFPFVLSSSALRLLFAFSSSYFHYQFHSEHV